jgi:magnesium chelatase family protein
MNPCPCGWKYQPTRTCRCTPHQITSYRNRISGPLLDRIDIHIDVPPVEYRDLASRHSEEPSSTIRERVEAARKCQLDRFAGDSVFANAAMSTRHVRRFCHLDDEGQTLLRQAMEARGLSARAYTKILKVARTIADLDESDGIQAHYVAEAVNYRSLDRALE